MPQSASEITSVTAAPRPSAPAEAARRARVRASATSGGARRTPRGQESRIPEQAETSAGGGAEVQIAEEDAVAIALCREKRRQVLPRGELPKVGEKVRPECPFVMIAHPDETLRQNYQAHG